MQIKNIFWEEYNKKSRDLPHNPLIEEGISYVNKKNIALDVGCGSGQDANFMAQYFSKVIAIDNNSGCKKYLNKKNIDFLSYEMEKYDFKKEKYNLINSWNTLVFMKPEKIIETVNKLLNSLTKEGVFVGNIFGPEDGWANRSDRSFLSEKEIRELFQNFKIIKLKEIRKTKRSVMGDLKKWHCYNFIIKK